MTREEEIIEAATNYGYFVAGGSPLRTAITEAYLNGVKYADQHPTYYNGQTNKMQEREVAFTDEWLKEHKERPTYADAIAWAEKRIIDKAYNWLFRNAENYMAVSGVGNWYNHVRLAEDFKKAMEK